MAFARPKHGQTMLYGWLLLQKKNGPIFIFVCSMIVHGPNENGVDMVGSVLGHVMCACAMHQHHP